MALRLKISSGSEVPTAIIKKPIKVIENPKYRARNWALMITNCETRIKINIQKRRLIRVGRDLREISFGRGRKSLGEVGLGRLNQLFAKTYGVSIWQSPNPTNPAIFPVGEKYEDKGDYSKEVYDKSFDIVKNDPNLHNPPLAYPVDSYNKEVSG